MIIFLLMKKLDPDRSKVLKKNDSVQIRHIAGYELCVKNNL